MRKRPEPNEAALYYRTYIDKAADGDILAVLETELGATIALLSGISESRSLHRYAPDKWSIREVLNHVNDTERLFVFRAFWFARGFDTPLPSFEQEVAASAARADDLAWARHIDEFRAVRAATLAFFRNLPEDAWDRRGVASGNPFTVNALAYIAAGHCEHHMAIVQERYS